MNEENVDSNQIENQNWQAPPPPPIEAVKAQEPAQMSEAATLGNIFISPGETFEDLRRKPRFILGILTILILTTAFQFLFVNKIGDERMKSFMAEQLEKNPQIQSMSAADKEKMIEGQQKIAGYTRYTIPVIFLIVIAIGGFVYWLAAKAMGGSGNYWHGISTWVYASVPPIVVSTLANILILLLKSPDDIDIAASQRGLIHANPSFFIDGKTSPVLATLVGTIDFFQIWGWILAAIGLQKVMRLSKASAWSIVLILALIGLAFRIMGAYFSGNPT